MLLVDSEDPIAITVAPWTHLRDRVGDGWVQPAGADETRCQMMVACMEAWFLGDPANLKEHYGGNFDETKLPPANQAETRTKTDINNALRQATRQPVSTRGFVTARSSLRGWIQLRYGRTASGAIGSSRRWAMRLERCYEAVEHTS